MRIFVSSTKQDLDDDCRPAVLRAIELFEGQSVAMEDWAAEYQPALELCRQKIAASTHYLGVFAYFRGWTPKGAPVSITESEVEYAQALPRPMAIFLPDETKAFARTLETRAKAAAQTEEQQKAQLEFLKRIRANGVVEHFHDATDLALRTARRVNLWKTPLAAMARVSPVPDGRRPREDQLCELGRDAQMTSFRAGLLALETPGAKPLTAFLLHGARRFGHEQLLTRLAAELEAGVREPPRRLIVSCGVRWRTGGLASLIAALGKEMRPGWKPTTVAEIAEAVSELLGVSDVVLQVTQIQLFEGGASDFASHFWLPLTRALTALPALRCRLFALLTDEGDTEPPAAPPDAAVPVPAPIVRLPRLEAFNAAELSVFLRRWVAPTDVAALAQALFDATRGSPDLLYESLLDDANWEI